MCSTRDRIRNVLVSADHVIERIAEYIDWAEGERLDMPTFLASLKAHFEEPRISEVAVAIQVTFGIPFNDAVDVVRDHPSWTEERRLFDVAQTFFAEHSEIGEIELRDEQE